MKPEEIAAVKKRCEAATEGPWDIDSSPPDLDRPTVLWAKPLQFAHGGMGESTIASFHTDADGEFCAHARSDIPSLLDYVATLEEHKEKLGEALRETSDGLRRCIRGEASPPKMFTDALAASDAALDTVDQEDQ